MSRDPIKDAAKVAETKEKILEAGFRIFAEKTIDKVSMNDVAEAAGLGVATLYRYYSSKPVLVLEICTWAWEKQIRRTLRSLDEIAKYTAAENLNYFLDVFLDIFQKNKDILRLNQFFNVYIHSGEVSPEMIKPYRRMIDALSERFHAIYEKGKADGTLRTDIPEAEIFSGTLHLMLAAVTRYAVGLVYDTGIEPERELLLLKKMLLREFTSVGEEIGNIALK